MNKESRSHARKTLSTCDKEKEQHLDSQFFKFLEVLLRLVPLGLQRVPQLLLLVGALLRMSTYTRQERN